VTTTDAAAQAATDQRVITYSEAVREAIGQAMEADDRVFMLGEDIGIYGGAFGVSGDLYHRFGAERIRDTPISELGIVGAAVGAAVAGMRPIVEIQFSDFTNQAMDQIVNQAAKIHFMLGGAATVPMVLRAPTGSGTGAAAQHSQSLEAWFAHVPGLKVVMPATAADAKGLLLAAIDDPNPVIVLEHKLLYRTSGPVPEEAVRIPLGKTAVHRTGNDLSIVATGVMVSRSLEAADILTAGTLRDPSNFGRDWRMVRDSLGVPDVTSHSFRKSLATLIDDDGLSARIGADHLGHSKVSMTQDRYMARGRLHTAVAALLDRTISDE
jgi:acetoin:2,6-dichlorophenolindophenol oxidoreductase subunit beta